MTGEDSKRGSDGSSPPDPASQNIEAVLEFYAHEEKKITPSQRLLEQTSHLLGRPVFIGMILAFVALWIGTNAVLAVTGRRAFDASPYSLLQGIIDLGALLTATIVLTRQNRLAGLAEQRAHLDLKVTLLTEQKVAKLIHLVEELRRDLPNVRDRHDPDALVMQQALKPDNVRAALDEAKSPSHPARPSTPGQ